MNNTKITTPPLKNIPYHTEWYSIYFAKHLNQPHLMQPGLPVQGISHIHELELVSRCHLKSAMIEHAPKHRKIIYDQESDYKFELTVLPPAQNHLGNTPTIFLKSSFQ